MQCRLEVAAELQQRWRRTNRRWKSIPRSSSSHRVCVCVVVVVSWVPMACHKARTWMVYVWRSWSRELLERCTSWLAIYTTASSYAASTAFHSLYRCDVITPQVWYLVYYYSKQWLGSRLVSVLGSGAEGPGFKLQPRRWRVTALGRLFTPIVPLFTKRQNW